MKDYYFINHYTFSIFIFIILIIIWILFIYIKEHTKLSKQKKIYIDLFSIVSIFIFIHFYWNYGNLVGFNNTIKSFNYYYPYYKVVNSFEYEDYSYVAYTKDNKFVDFVCFYKKNNKWYKYNQNGINFGVIKPYLNNDKYSYQLYKISDNNTIGIIISYMRKTDEKTIIKDSTNSNINHINFQTNKKNINDPYDIIENIYIVINTDKANKDYTIYINNDMIRLFK